MRQRRQKRKPRKAWPAVCLTDRDGDGRLTGPERKQAKRFVMKHRRQLRQEHRQQRGM